MSLAEKIRDRRKALGLHQYQFAQKVCASQSTVSDWENGVQLPHPSRLITIADALNLSVRALRAAYRREIGA